MSILGMSIGNLTVKTTLILGIGTPVLLMAILGAIMFANIQVMITNSHGVTHDHKVLAASNAIVQSALNMETGMRGYLLAGKDEFLDSYKNGEKKIFDTIAVLTKSVSQQPEQVQRLQEIDKSIKQWEDKAVEKMAVRREIGHSKTMNDMAQLVGEQRGKVYFNKFRQQIAQFIQAEQSLLEQRQRQFIASKQSIINNIDDIVLVKSRLQVMEESEIRVIHSYDVIDQARQILAAAVDMETGMRGYLLAGQEIFLGPYKSGEASFKQQLAQLVKTVSDNPAQVSLLNEIEKTISAWQQDVTEPMIALRREIGDAKTMDDIADLVGEKQGKEYFDKFRAIMGEFMDVEQQLMEQREQRNDVVANSAKVFIVISIIITILVSTLLGLFIIRNLLKKAGQRTKWGQCHNRQDCQWWFIRSV